MYLSFASPTNSSTASSVLEPPAPDNARGRRRQRTVTWKGRWQRGVHSAPQMSVPSPPPAAARSPREGFESSVRAPLPLRPAFPPALPNCRLGFQRPWLRIASEDVRESESVSDEARIVR